MIMDFLRTCYRRPATIFSNDDTPIMIRWYRAPVGAKCFPQPHKYLSLDWSSAPWAALGVGENFDGKKAYANGFTPPSAAGENYFGSLLDFEQGPAFDSATNVPRDSWGLAVACGSCVSVVLMEQSGDYPILMETDGYVLTELGC